MTSLNVKSLIDFGASECLGINTVDDNMQMKIVGVCVQAIHNLMLFQPHLFCRSVTASSTCSVVGLSPRFQLST